MDSTRFWVYLVLVIVGIAGAGGDIAINLWAKSRETQWWVISCLVWIVVATLFGIVLRWEHFTFGAAVVIALLTHAICAVLFDWFWYKTHLTAMQWIGIATALLAIGFIEGGKKAPDIPPSTSIVRE